MSILVTLRRRAPVLVTLIWAAAAQAQPPGGFSGGYRPDPGEIVDRMDENKNGQIDVDEMQGRARFFLEGLARDNGLDLNKPIGKDKLRDMLKARFGGSSSSGGSSNGSSSGGSSSSSSSRDSDRYRSSKFNEPAAPVVQGFGIAAAPDASAKVPGFGPPPSADSWDLLKQKYNDRVIDEIEESLDRYDRDRDGLLDREEVKNGRFRGEPMDYDRNKDGKLSRSELAVRYEERESGGSSSGGSSGNSSSNNGSSSSRSSYGGGPPGPGFGGGYGGGPPGGFSGGYGGGPPGGFSGGYGFRGPPPGGGSSSGGSSNNSSSSSGGSSTSSSSRGPSSSGSSSGGPSGSGSSNGGSSNGGSSGGGSSGGSSSGGSSPKEKELQERVAKMADQIMRIYDADKNGEIGKDEMSKVAAAYQKADYDGNGKISKDELSKYALGLVAPSGSSTASTSSSGGVSSSSSVGGSTPLRRYGPPRASSSSKPTSSKSSGDRKPTYRFLGAIERLPQGLPEWFASNDADADGQIAMSEFSKSWDDAKVKEFADWDQNGDGIITAGECLKKAQ